MKITVTEKHLDRAIEERPSARNGWNRNICETCLMAQAVRELLPSATVAFGNVRIHPENDPIFTYKDTVGMQLEASFDAKNYTSLRLQLPVEVELTPVS